MTEKSPEEIDRELTPFRVVDSFKLVVSLDGEQEEFMREKIEEAIQAERDKRKEVEEELTVAWAGKKLSDAKIKELKKLEEDLEIADEVLHYRFDNDWRNYKEIQKLKSALREAEKVLENIKDHQEFIMGMPNKNISRMSATFSMADEALKKIKELND